MLVAFGTVTYRLGTAISYYYILLKYPYALSALEDPNTIASTGSLMTPAKTLPSPIQKFGLLAI